MGPAPTGTYAQQYAPPDAQEGQHFWDSRPAGAADAAASEQNRTAKNQHDNQRSSDEIPAASSGTHGQDDWSFDSQFLLSAVREEITNDAQANPDSEANLLPFLFQSSNDAASSSTEAQSQLPQAGWAGNEGGNMAAGGVPVVGMHAAMPMGGYQPMPYAPINGGSNLAYNVGSWDKRPQSHLSHLFTAPDGTETYVAPGAMGMPVPWVAGGEPAPGSFAADGAAGYSGVWGGPAAAYGGGGYSGSYMPGYAPADNQDFANGIHYPNQPDDAQA
jgi:hypothetical protein